MAEKLPLPPRHCNQGSHALVLSIVHRRRHFRGASHVSGGNEFLFFRVGELELCGEESKKVGRLRGFIYLVGIVLGGNRWCCSSSEHIVVYGSCLLHRERRGSTRTHKIYPSLFYQRLAEARRHCKRFRIFYCSTIRRGGFCGERKARNCEVAGLIVLLCSILR